MENTKINWKKILIGAFTVVLTLALVLVIGIFALWHNEIATVGSMKMVRPANPDHGDGPVYQMEVSGGFYLEEFIAQGGVESDQELIDFITGNITRGLVDMTITEPEIACASFTATAENGDALFARNYDFDETSTCLVFTEGDADRHATISTVDLQFLGIDTEKGIGGLMDKVICLAAPYVPLDGINDAGVSCGIYMTYQGDETVPTNQNTEKPDLTSTTMLRLILDYADSVEEAVELVSRYDLHDSAGTSYHYMVADATGKSAVLEWIHGTDLTDNEGGARQLVVTYNDDDADVGRSEGESDYQWVTNFILRPGYYGSDSEKKGFDRYEKLGEELTARNGVVEGAQEAMDILAMVGRRNWDNDDKNGCTVHSAVYNMTEKSVLWVSNENYDDSTAIFEFSLEK